MLRESILLNVSFTLLSHFRGVPVPFFYTGSGTGFFAQKTGGSGSGFQKKKILFLVLVAVGLCTFFFLYHLCFHFILLIVQFKIHLLYM